MRRTMAATTKKTTRKKAPAGRTRSATAARGTKAPTRKEVGAKKDAAKKPVAKKAAAKKRPAVKKANAKGAVAAKPASRRPPAGKPAAGPTRGPDGAVAAPDSPKPVRRRKNTHLTAKELRQFEKLLLNLRDQVVDEISFLAGDNLDCEQVERTGEEGTDNFNREFALKLVSSEQDIIYEIDEALRRIKTGAYGVCEYSGEPIEKERLKVLPYARHSVRIQSELERGKSRYRPFGPSLTRP